MPRVARIAWAGCPYHVTHRGNHGIPVFIDDSDRAAYLTLLSANSRQHGLRVWAYCLMPNHVHLIVVGDHERSMAGCLRETQRGHAVRINKRIQRTGHLWGDRFFSSPMDDHHLWAAVRYIELNPVRARFVTRAVDFAWSSAQAHALHRGHPVLDPERPFPGAIEDWESWLAEGVCAEELESIRRCTANGRPCGSADFVHKVEAVTGRVLVATKGGRPRRSQASSILDRRGS